MRLHLLALLMASFASTAHAEKLLLMGEIKPIGIEIFIDTDTLHRGEQWGSARFISIVPQGERYPPSVIRSDCTAPVDQAILRLYDEGMPVPVNKDFVYDKNGEKWTLQTKTLLKMHNTLCKKFYEIWK